MEAQERLSADIHLLGDTLGKVIRQQAGVKLFGLVELARAYTKARRNDNDETINDTIDELIDTLSLAEKADLARAFTTYFELINIAEANNRIRVARERERDTYPEPPRKSIAAAIVEMWRVGVDEDEMRRLLERLSIELVFTAHPTEAKRRTLLSKLRRISRKLRELENNTNLLPREVRKIQAQLQAEVTNIWLTGRTRTTKPKVEDEVRTGMFYLEEPIWEVVPEVYRALHDALRDYYPNLKDVPQRFLTFGSWMGGDRDGNPFVTSEVTAETLRLHRGLALEQHRAVAQGLNRSLSMSSELTQVSAELQQHVDQNLQDPGPHVQFLAERYPNEPYRLASAMLAADLKNASAVTDMKERLLGHEGTTRPALETLQQLLTPIIMMDESLKTAKVTPIAETELAAFRTQAEVFGLHAAMLDIRQESAFHDEVLDELFREMGIEDDYLALNAQARTVLLTQLLDEDVPTIPDVAGLSQKSAETVKLLQLLKVAIDVYGNELFGSYVISMTRSTADVLTVLLLTYWFGINRRTDGQPDGMGIGPLFETRADLVAASSVMVELFEHEVYAAHLASLDQQQMIMIGYSDSNKDAGFLSANWELYQAQRHLADTCRQWKVVLTLFHGRGGTIARGGGPMKRAILAQPHGSVDGRFRITEQGEVLYERYATNDIAQRHLEQVVYSVLMASNPQRKVKIRPEWIAAMNELSDVAHKTYREFVYETPALVTYWTQATPLQEIGRMRIGSRPSKRAKSDDPFAFLRAIPWVFSWMQSRHVLPGWYGIGKALEGFATSEENIKLLQEMYEQWDFFRGIIENAQMSLGKADMGIARLYAELVKEDDIREQVYAEIKAGYDRSCRWILHITGQRALLANQAVVQRSIRVRNPYVDPLNFIQIDLLRRYRALDPNTPEAEELLEAIFLTINGIAAGLKNTG
ncbi:MAG: phosphoenolpyruvate carboxylase [Candidatus Promineifilaceae bacterium]